MIQPLLKVKTKLQLVKGKPIPQLPLLKDKLIQQLQLKDKQIIPQPQLQPLIHPQPQDKLTILMSSKDNPIQQPLLLKPILQLPLLKVKEMLQPPVKDKPTILQQQTKLKQTQQHQPKLKIMQQKLLQIKHNLKTQIQLKLLEDLHNQTTHQLEVHKIQLLEVRQQLQQQQ